MAVTDEQRKKNLKDNALKVGVISGIVFAYFFGYAARIGELNTNNDILTSLIQTFIELTQGHLFYKPSISVYLGWLLGCVGGFFVWLWFHNDSVRHFTTDMETSAGSGGFMTEEEFKEYADEFISKDPDPIPGDNSMMQKVIKK